MSGEGISGDSAAPVCDKCGQPHDPSATCAAAATELGAGQDIASAATADPDAPVRQTLPMPKPTPGSGRPRNLGPGQMVDQYKITQRLGKGGMGEVFGGVQPLIGKKVAIKVLQASVASNPSVVSRFVQEARAVNQIRSRHIVDIFSFGELENGQPYFVMELLEGPSLRRFLRDEGTLSFSQALDILRCVIKGLEAAHAVGVVHRDLKPENIVVLEEEGVRSAKLLDFGIAKLTGTASNPEVETRTGASLGTPYYMSPEQVRGAQVDHRTDIYALGIIMFEMFVGALPFDAKSYIDVVNQHLYAPPPKPSELSAEVPAPLEQLVLQCLAKEADARPGTVLEVLETLERLAPEFGDQRFARTEPQIRPEAAPPVFALAVAPPATKDEPEGRARAPYVWVATAALVVLVAIGGAWYALSGGGSDGAELPVAAQPAAPAANASPAPPAPSKPAPAGETPPSGAKIAAGLARLSVKTGDPRATYSIDGAVVGTGSELKMTHRPGKYELSVSAPQKVTLKQKVLLSAGQTLELTPELKDQPKRARRKVRRRGRARKKARSANDRDKTLNPFSR